MNVVLEEKAAAKQREDQEGLEPVSRKKKPENSAIVTELEAGEEAMEEELTAVSDGREEEEMRRSRHGAAVNMITGTLYQRLHDYQHQFFDVRESVTL